MPFRSVFPERVLRVDRRGVLPRNRWDSFRVCFFSPPLSVSLSVPLALPSIHPPRLSPPRLAVYPPAILAHCTHQLVATQCRLRKGEKGP